MMECPWHGPVTDETTPCCLSAMNKVYQMQDARQWAQDAIFLQDAVNLSGIVYSFAKMMEELRKQAPDKGTSWYNQHPLAVMFADKIASLTGVQNLGNTTFTVSYDWCHQTASGLRPNNFEV